jgi:hypothetical protein
MGKRTGKQGRQQITRLWNEVVGQAHVVGPYKMQISVAECDSQVIRFTYCSKTLTNILFFIYNCTYLFIDICTDYLSYSSIVL